MSRERGSRKSKSSAVKTETGDKESYQNRKKQRSRGLNGITREWMNGKAVTEKRKSRKGDTGQVLSKDWKRKKKDRG